MVEEGLRAADAGELIGDEELGNRIDHWVKEARPIEQSKVSA